MTELNKQYSTNPTTPLDTTTLTDLHDQLRRKSDILLDLNKKVSVLIDSEEDSERRVIEAEEHHSSLLMNVVRITQALYRS